MSALNASIPVIETERVILRGPIPDDLAPLTAFFETDNSQFVGGPMGANETHRALLATLGSWSLYGYGPWHIAEAATNRFMGWTGLLRTAGKSEPGFAWTVLPAFQGKGFASEAARAALDHVRTIMGHAPVATFIDSANAPSIRLAEKLGFAHNATIGTEMTFRLNGGAG